jgi:hypothetical protein
MNLAPSGTMSALPPKADIGCDLADVRFGPIADKRGRGWIVR